MTNGCVLAPALFSLAFSAMLTEAFNDSSSGISITYRCDGKFFNFRRLQAITKIKETSIRDLLFADDCALNAINEHQMQQEVDQFSSPCENFGLNIVSACTKKPLPRTSHFSEETEAKGSRKLHLSWQHPFSLCKH